MPGARGSMRRGVAKTRLFLHTMRDLGPRTIGAVVANSVRRSRQVRRDRAAEAPEVLATAPGPLRSVRETDQGVRIAFADAQLELVFPANDILRITWGPGTEPVPYALDPGFVPASTPVRVERDGAGAVVVGAADLGVVVEEDGTTTVSWRGAVVRREQAPARRGPKWEQRFTPRPGERFTGLGEQAAPLDRAGGRYRLWNRDPGGAWGVGKGPLYMPLPVLVGLVDGAPVLSFYENSTRGVVELPGSGDTGDVSLSFAGGVLRQYLIVGDDVRTLLERYGALTGRAPVPPRWALGYHQSRWGYKCDAHVDEVVGGYAAMDVPLSAIHLDIDYMQGYRVFTIDRSRFPDLGALARRAEARGVRLVTIVDPAVKVDPRYGLYRQGCDGGHFCTSPQGDVEVGVVWPGRAAFPDFTNPRTRQWWASQYAVLADAGVAGIWHDMNEPTSISLSGDPTLPVETRHHLEGRGGDHGEAHNVYGLLMNQAGAEGLRAARPDRRPWIVSRSGWAGSQRHAWNWTGDVETSWEGLRQQIATVVGLGLSGVAYSGPDIGGFSGVPDDELYLRWLQMAVLLPFCRTHSVVGAPPREPWRFAEPTRSFVAEWIRLRYRLLPYLYALAREAAETGAPLVRPPWWPGAGAPGDEDGTFLLGDALLVAPVTEPAAEARRVELPDGDWHGWWAADESSARRVEAVLDAPAGRIPVLVRGGSIVPLDDGWASPAGPCALGGDASLERIPGPPDGGHAPRLLALHCWPDAAGDAMGHAVDDEGDGQGPERRDVFELTGATPGGTATLRWRCQGEFPMPGRVRVVVHGVAVGEAAADGQPVPSARGAVACGPFAELQLQLGEPVGSDR
ncbi:MAG: glycoside hydrolase family 31 protein [Acidimicrobiales bacterium]